MEPFRFMVDRDPPIISYSDFKKLDNSPVDHLKVIDEIRTCIRNGNLNQIYELWNGKTLRLVKPIFTDCVLPSISSEKPSRFSLTKVCYEMYAILDTLHKLNVSTDCLNRPSWLYKGYVKDFPLSVTKDIHNIISVNLGEILGLPILDTNKDRNIVTNWNSNWRLTYGVNIYQIQILFNSQEEADSKIHRGTLIDIHTFKNKLFNTIPFLYKKKWIVVKVRILGEITYLIRGDVNVSLIHAGLLQPIPGRE